MLSLWWLNSYAAIASFSEKSLMRSLQTSLLITDTLFLAIKGIMILDYPRNTATWIMYHSRHVNVKNIVDHIRIANKN